MRAQGDAPRIALIDAVEGATDGAVMLARIADLSKLFDGRSRRLHKDIVDVLVDLTVSLLDEESRGESTNH